MSFQGPVHSISNSLDRRRGVGETTQREEELTVYVKRLSFLQFSFKDPVLLWLRTDTLILRISYVLLVIVVQPVKEFFFFFFFVTFLLPLLLIFLSHYSVDLELLLVPFPSFISMGVLNPHMYTSFPADCPTEGRQ